MTKDTRTDIQIYSAIAMLFAGVALATAGFIVPPTGEISDSVLLFFAQCLIYAGSIFGVSIYIHTKFAELKAKDTRTPEQKEAFVKILTDIHKRFPNATLHGHREFAAKDCPSFDVHEYDYIFK